MLFAFVCGVTFYSKLDLSFKLLTWLLGTTFFVECGAFYLASAYGNNLALYNLFLIAQFVFISLYFNFSIDTFRPKGIGIWAGAIGVLFGAINIVFFQSLHQVGSYFLLLTGIAIISMSLYSFARALMIREDDSKEHEVFRCPHFWISVIFVFFWSTSFLLWGLYEYFSQRSAYLLPLVHTAIRIVNILTYSAIGTTISLYHLKRRNAVLR